MNQILFKLPSVHGDFKTYCLEILCSRVEHIPNLFTELKTKGLKEILAHRYASFKTSLHKLQVTFEMCETTLFQTSN